MLTVLSAFSGTGGLCELGIREAGLSDFFQVAQFIEINQYRQNLLKKQFPHIPIHSDIRDFRGEKGKWDVCVSGTPCQNISRANPQRNGFAGERSSLWWEMFRIISECQPKYVIWENVAAARYPTPGDRYSPLAYVIGNLTSIGYLCEWITVSAAALGAPHNRERILLVATNTDGTQSGKELLQSPWTGQVGAQVETTWSSTQGGDKYARIAGMDARSTTWLDSYNLGGWWLDNPPPQQISAPVRSIPNRGKRVQLIGDSCTPAQAAIAWRRVAYFARELFPL